MSASATQGGHKNVNVYMLVTVGVLWFRTVGRLRRGRKSQYWLDFPVCICGSWAAKRAAWLHAVLQAWKRLLVASKLVLLRINASPKPHRRA